MSERAERVRTTIGVHGRLMDKAKEIMSTQDFSDFSAFVEHLIREEWKRHCSRSQPEKIVKK